MQWLLINKILNPTTLRQKKKIIKTQILYFGVIYYVDQIRFYQINLPSSAYFSGRCLITNTLYAVKN